MPPERVEPQGDVLGQEAGKPVLQLKPASGHGSRRCSEPDGDAEPAPAEPEAAIEDKPVAAAEPAPEPSRDQIFEELDAQEASTPFGDEQEMTDEPAADPLATSRQHLRQRPASLLTRGSRTTDEPRCESWLTRKRD